MSPCVSMGSPFQMTIYRGPELIAIYNDAFCGDLQSLQPCDDRSKRAPSRTPFRKEPG